MYERPIFVGGNIFILLVTQNRDLYDVITQYTALVQDKPGGH